MHYVKKHRRLIVIVCLFAFVLTLTSAKLKLEASTEAETNAILATKYSFEKVEIPEKVEEEEELVEEPIRIEEPSEEELIQSIWEKIAFFPIYKDMDMSQRMGFSRDEIKYILMNLPIENSDELIVEDEVFAEKLAGGIFVALQQHEVNELFIISVMMWESGWLKSPAASNNNFGGQMTDEGTTARYDTVEIGAYRVVSSLSQDMKGNNTALEIARVYRARDEAGNKRWANKVFGIMKNNVAAEIMSWHTY